MIWKQRYMVWVLALLCSIAGWADIRITALPNDSIDIREVQTDTSVADSVATDSIVAGRIVPVFRGLREIVC